MPAQLSLRLSIQGDAFVDPTLHDQDVGHGVGRPGIAWIQLQRLAAEPLRRLIVERLLVGKGTAGQIERIVRRVVLEGRCRTFDDVAHIVGVTHPEIFLLDETVAQQVGRMLAQHGFVLLGRVHQPAGGGGLQRFDVAAFAWADVGDAGFGGIQGFIDDVGVFGAAATDQEDALEGVREGAVGIGGECGAQMVHHVDPPVVETLDRPFQVTGRLGVGCRQGQPPAVDSHCYAASLTSRNLPRPTAARK